MTHRSERLLNMLYAMPRSPEIEERKRRFDDLNAFISQRGGWMTSVPGAHKITFDALPGSPLPEQLAALGYIVHKTGEGERILPNAVQQWFEMSSSGALIAATDGSTKPVSLVVTAASLARVEQFDLRMP
jgi:hypothetical protein